MKQPPCSYIIQVQYQPRGDAAAARKGRAATITTSTVRVGDQAELVSLLAGMHRDGVLILSVRYETFPGLPQFLHPRRTPCSPSDRGLTSMAAGTG